MIRETVKALAPMRYNFSNMSLRIACQQSVRGLGLPVEKPSPPWGGSV